ncbi:MlaD family protein [Rhodococcus sp. USK13]|uniref:MlaD family protein n=1 Tax=Rhodococcus sp. USK13 TaxID=2806442 RepID=UPI002016D762|nr:MlaD family protein [Rhodococcus sp. USK13]
MSKPRNQDFIRGSDEHQTRIVNLAGGSAIVLVVIVLVTAIWIRPLLTKPDGLRLTVETPHVGPGVAEGTRVILRGAEVGEVTSVEKTDQDKVLIHLSLKPGEVKGLTDSMDLDFRPLNYFGVSAVNLVAKEGGNTLSSGEELQRTAVGDYTMSRLLEEGSHTIDGTLTTSMIATLNKVIRYSDGMTPLIQTGIVLADEVARTQREMPSALLSRVNDILDVMPAFSDQAIQAFYLLFDTKFNKKPDGSFGVNDLMMDRGAAGLDLASKKLFGSAGILLASHSTELTPLTEIARAFATALPNLLDNGTALGKLASLVDQYNNVFSANGDKRVLNLRVVLDDLPSLAAPLSAMAGATAPQQEVAPR